MSGPVVTYEDVAVGQYNASYAGYGLLSLADLQDSFIQEVFTWAYNAQGGLTNLMVGIKPGNCCLKRARLVGTSPLGQAVALPLRARRRYAMTLNDAVVGFRAGFSSACETELSAITSRRRPLHRVKVMTPQPWLLPQEERRCLHPAL